MQDDRLWRWLAEQRRRAEGSYRFDRIEQLLVPNIARLLSHFREAGLPVVFVRLGAQMRGCRDLIPHLRNLELAFGNIEGEREYEILDELAPLPGEAVVTKLSASAFTSSGIEALLRNLGAKSLVLTGVSTSQCVDLTARDAADRGFHCLVVRGRGCRGPRGVAQLDARAVSAAVRTGLRRRTTCLASWRGFRPRSISTPQRRHALPEKAGQAQRAWGGAARTPGARSCGSGTLRGGQRPRRAAAREERIESLREVLWTNARRSS